LQTSKKKDKIATMNTTLNTLISTINTEINEGVIDNLVNLGYSHQEATKVVSDFSDFDLVENAAQFPVSEQELPF
jgi:Holliday junction resolvasome RuvABC DNA-binding subunit